MYTTTYFKALAWKREMLESNTLSTEQKALLRRVSGIDLMRLHLAWHDYLLPVDKPLLRKRH